MLVRQRLPYYSLGHWLGKMLEGEVFTYSKGDLTRCLEKYLPLILLDFPLPLALAAYALNPKSNQICMQIIHGGDFFEALYRFYNNDLYVCPNNFCWISEYDDYLPEKLTWDSIPDIPREKIFRTGIYVTELLPLEDEYFTCAQIEQLSKIDFSF